MNDKPASLDGVQHGGDHYKSLAIEPAMYCQRNHLDFCESEAIKYLTRHGAKGGAEDVKKALHFCAMILDMVYGITATTEFAVREVDGPQPPEGQTGAPGPAPPHCGTDTENVEGERRNQA